MRTDRAIASGLLLVALTLGAPAFAEDAGLQKLLDRAEIEALVARFMGRYEEMLVKRDGHWLIQSRKLVSFVQ